MQIHGKDVAGAIDRETRCTHYHSEVDRIAIKFYCCDAIYPCVHCHEEHADHEIVVWPKEYFDEQAVLCGACGQMHDIHTYLTAKDHCPSCGAAYNPLCARHNHYYFETEKGDE
ncbi:hypothetical protein FLK61_40715 [Paenalkalicoccus suaedae]|uniref:CHY-type domain-containing protein n=1 Tax=Paenalkalicoccus suaedae TaxID=2592382 RepID=A0A859FJE7_9BACI|nr:CHY zinc finger protein [Paenalkalicoccus suaedae]QKS72925.1 hypothetical protein FLK61_40715 [Paenalkalicoccus suaedae]